MQCGTKLSHDGKIWTDLNARSQVSEILRNYITVQFCLNSNLDLYKFLNEFKPDRLKINSPDGLGMTALTWAASRGNVKALEVLLNYCKNNKIKLEKQNEAIALAADFGHTTIQDVFVADRCLDTMTDIFCMPQVIVKLMTSYLY